MNVNIPNHPPTPSYVVPGPGTSLYILYIIIASVISCVFSGQAISNPGYWGEVTRRVYTACKLVSIPAEGLTLSLYLPLSPSISLPPSLALSLSLCLSFFMGAKGWSRQAFWAGWALMSCKQVKNQTTNVPSGKNKVWMLHIKSTRAKLC